MNAHKNQIVRTSTLPTFSVLAKGASRTLLHPAAITQAWIDESIDKVSDEDRYVRSAILKLGDWATQSGADKLARDHGYSSIQVVMFDDENSHTITYRRGIDSGYTYNTRGILYQLGY